MKDCQWDNLQWSHHWWCFKPPVASASLWLNKWLFVASSSQMRESGLMTHAENMTPAWYRTGMEICTELSRRVEGSSSLSLWPGDSRKQKMWATGTLSPEWKQFFFIFWVGNKSLTSPSCCDVDLNELLDVFGVRLKRHSELLLQTWTQRGHDELRWRETQPHGASL